MMASNDPLPTLHAPSRRHTAALSLHVVIVGAGLGGLSAAYCLGKAGHNVTVLEAAERISEVGAGIQSGPNLTRLLIRWGLDEKLKEMAVVPEGISFRRWKTGERVGWTKWGDTMEKAYGAPYYHIHRADFINLLHDLAAPYMTLRLSSRVVSVCPSASSPSVTLSSGQTISCDLIIGADGIKSIVREVVVGHPDNAVKTGDAAYRAIISTEAMMKDEDLRSLVEFPEMTGWMGPGRHIVGYCIRAKKEYNLVMLHPDLDDGSVESWTSTGSADKMRADFTGWEARVQKMLSLVPSTLNWILMDRAPLDTWVHTNGRVTLLGDACHPMLPYRAQGSAMAVEDAAVLGNLFTHLSHHSQITPLLQAYQSLRLARTSETQASSRLNQHIFHLEDGEEQEKRDQSMLEAWRGALSSGGTQGNANQWADQRKNWKQFGYDADEEAERWWKEEGEGIRAMAGLISRPRL